MPKVRERCQERTWVSMSFVKIYLFLMFFSTWEVNWRFEDFWSLCKVFPLTRSCWLLSNLFLLKDVEGINSMNCCQVHQFKMLKDVEQCRRLDLKVRTSNRWNMNYQHFVIMYIYIYSVNTCIYIYISYMNFQLLIFWVVSCHVGNPSWQVAQLIRSSCDAWNARPGDLVLGQYHEG